MFAFNYGSRREIVGATRSLASRVATGSLGGGRHRRGDAGRSLYIPDMPDVDLVIRSSGEHRLSNFLLWQAAYAEFHFPGSSGPTSTGRPCSAQ